jgi:hypothetical protein
VDKTLLFLMPAETYFIAWKGKRDGPYSLEQLADLLQNGEIGFLHRVETSAGPIALRQLLLAADPARWSNLAQAPGAAPQSTRTPAPFQSPAPSHVEAPAPTAQPSASNPFGQLPTNPTGASSNPGSPLQPINPSTRQPSPPAQPLAISNQPSAISADPPEALRAYIVAGLTFLFPPLAGYAFFLTQKLADRGHAQLARRLHVLYAALALTGLLFWILIWKMW